MGNMRFKVGDRVRVKSLDWYNMHCDDAGNVDCGCEIFEKDMKPYLGKVFTIHRIVDNSKYEMEEAFDFFLFTDEMIEGLVEEETQQKFKVGDRVITNKGYIGKFEGWVSDYQVKVLFEESGCDVVIHPKDLKLMEEETKSNVIEETKNYWDSIKDGWICPEGYQFKDENGNIINATKIVLEKKKKEYPKSYEECLNILGYNIAHTIPMNHGHNGLLIMKLQRLLIYRDAYWKLYGEEMGLGKPWKPDGNPVYALTRNDGYIVDIETGGNDEVLEFPTEEMRDAFYENFKELIESVKELL